VFSSIDYQGRYAYSNQPHAMHWNLARLAEALLPLLVEEEGSDEAGLASAYEALEKFGSHFEATLHAGLRRKLGLFTESDEDIKLADDLLQRMAENRADYTLTFRRLCDAAARIETSEGARTLFADPSSFDAWETAWRNRLKQESISPEKRAEQMRLANPVFIPRNHLVEAAIQAGVERQNFQPFEDLLKALAQPYDDRPGMERYSTSARPEEYVRATFCGT
jgi:uncharacterized protein YdiU (UPF0061 family)